LINVALSKRQSLSVENQNAEWYEFGAGTVPGANHATEPYRWIVEA
jgi:hypothetical protein